jgi:alginate O-acetyltransferase complex protein AlgI
MAGISRFSPWTRPLQAAAGNARSGGRRLRTPSGLVFAETPGKELSVVFSSALFLFYFLLVSVLGYYALPKIARHLWLAVVSYVFYGWWNPGFMLLMLASTALDYSCGLLIWRWGWRRLGLCVSVGLNLACLCFFKYAAFAWQSAASLAAGLGFDVPEVPTALATIVLPMGISFYTFQTMSYCIDLYRGHAPPARSFIDFTCYVSFYPQLVAGPIVRYGSIAHQLVHREHSWGGFTMGVSRFCLGFSKKILLADPCGSMADVAFQASPEALASPAAWVGLVAYTCQIYFDFSAYSDMAIGLGRLFGFRFVENFDSPYRSLSITEFWQRWHISLSSFLRDYLYIPLGGNRLGAARTYVNLMTVMLLGGLWHGAQWTFVVWGAIHGLLLAVERWMGRDAWTKQLPKPVRMTMTLLVVLVGWVFFRSATFSAAWAYLAALVGGVPSVNAELGQMLLATQLSGQGKWVLVTSALVIFAAPNSQTFLSSLRAWKAGLCVAIFTVSVAVMFQAGFSPFLYFQF